MLHRRGELRPRAHDARAAIAELAPPAGGVGAAGSEWVAARQRDVDAVRAGKPATAVGDVLRAHPDRYAAALAAATIAEQAVTDWNDNARRDVKPATVKAITSLVRDAHQDALSAAARATVAADEAGTDDSPRTDGTTARRQS